MYSISTPFIQQLYHYFRTTKPTLTLFYIFFWLYKQKEYTSFMRSTQLLLLPPHNMFLDILIVPLRISFMLTYTANRKAKHIRYTKKIKKTFDFRNEKNIMVLSSHEGKGESLWQVFLSQVFPLVHCEYRQKDKRS